MKNASVDLLAYRDVKCWNPAIGDVIFKDGILFRWCAVVNGIKESSINVRRSGNMHLLISGEYKDYIINVNQIKSARFGVYMIIRDGIYYV